MADAAYTPTEKVDITDVVCPVTFVKTKVALEELEDGQILQVHLNDGDRCRMYPEASRMRVIRS